MCELLEKAREAQGGISYYEVAKRLGISTPLMNKWKNNKSKPNGINTLKLAKMAELSVEEALVITDEKGYVSLILVTGLAGMSLFYWVCNSIVCILCQIEHVKKINQNTCKLCIQS